MRNIQECYEEALRLLSENKELHVKLADYLIAKETITGKEFMKIYREEKGIEETVSEETIFGENE